MVVVVVIAARNYGGRLRSRGTRWRGIGAGRPRGVRRGCQLVVEHDDVDVGRGRGVSMMRGAICVSKSCRRDGRVVRENARLVFCSENIGTRVVWLSLAPVFLSWLPGLQGRD